VSGLIRILLVSGSLRRDSTNTALLRTALVMAPPDIAAVLYDGMDRLPHFNPDDDGPTVDAAVAHLRDQIHASDAILLSTPEYAGALPGSFKNLLDWTIGDEQPGSIYEKPVAWVNVSASPTGAVDAYAELGKVLGFAHARVIKEACDPIPVARQDVEDGLILDPAIRAAITHTLRTLADHAAFGAHHPSHDHEK
jgi:chromate reductase